MTITDIIQSKAFIILAIAALVAAAVYFSGLYSVLKRILYDWLMDHTTGRYTINNGARVLGLFTILFIEIATSFVISLQPHFHIEPKPYPETKLFGWFALILGLTWVNKANLFGPGSTKTEVTSEGTTIINTAPQAAKTAPVKDTNVPKATPKAKPAPDEDEPILG